MKNKLLTALFFFTIALSQAYSQPDKNIVDFPNGKFWGLAFGDYFYKAGGDSTGTSLEYTKYRKDFNSFEFRRIQAGFDYNFNEKFSSQISLSYDGEELTQDGKRTVYVRDANFKWKNIFTNSDLSFGILPTPGYSIVSDKVWGYRSIERTIMDQRGILGSRDIGIQLNGSFDKEKKFGYYFMIGNGRGLRLENNKYKRFYGNLIFNTLSKNIQFNVYADYEPAGPSTNRFTLQSFLGFQLTNHSFGVEAFEQQQKSQSTAAGIVTENKITPFGISAFFHGKLFADNLKYLFRYDYYDTDIGNKQHFIIAGMDFTPEKRIHIIPNLWLNMYGGINRVSEVVPRITFYFDSR